MEACSPFGICIHYCEHVLNPALQDTVTQIEPLGSIQAPYNVLEASPKQHTLFGDTEVQGEDLKLMLHVKSLGTTWSCWLEAVKAIYRQMERTVKALLTLSSDKDPKTYFNPLMPNSDLSILLCLTPDDFTCQRETPWALKG